MTCVACCGIAVMNVITFSLSSVVFVNEKASSRLIVYYFVILFLLLYILFCQLSFLHLLSFPQVLRLSAVCFAPRPLSKCYFPSTSPYHRICSIFAISMELVVKADIFFSSCSFHFDIF